MRNLVFIVASFSLLIFEGGCAVGPIGPPLGLGPGLDQVVFWGLILIGAVLLWPRAQRFIRKNASGSRPTVASAGIQVAAERYAKGEINRDEYLKMVDDLRHGSN